LLVGGFWLTSVPSPPLPQAASINRLNSPAEDPME
jgi:hypothetical protein